MYLVKVIVPVAVPGSFTYQIPFEIENEAPLIGRRVIIPFGNRQIVTGVIESIAQENTSHISIREVLDVIDDQPVISSEQIHFFHWLSAYYMCTLGEVLIAALPSALKLTGDVTLSLNQEIDPESVILSEKEQLLVDTLKHDDLPLDEVKKLLDLKHPQKLIKSLFEKGLVDVFEKLKDKYRPRKEPYLRLNPAFTEQETLETLINELEKKPKQQEVLLSYLRKIELNHLSTKNQDGIAQKTLLAEGISPSSLKTLVGNGILEKWDKIINRFDYSEHSDIEFPKLSPEQQFARDQIEKHFKEKQVVLLHGVTGSGKTEIYINMIRDCLAQGGKVLYLLPEIALTTQIIKRFRSYFGNQFGVFHSRFSDNERAEIYFNYLQNKFSFIIGVRSAVFLPHRQLDLIIVDEEHDQSYKQFDPAPRYHARDAVIYLAHQVKANVLLGTATPSLESLHNAGEGKYGYVALESRFGDQPLPDIQYANLTKARKQKKLKGSFTEELLEHLQRSLNEKKQVILFRNRRGYAPYIECQDCLSIPKCPNCAVSLTYHIYQNQLICHYCGFREAHESTCSFCNSTQLKTVGTGTEKIEEELALLLPDVKIQRMDLDTTRSKNAYQQIIDDFESGEIQILVGTQMVTKGLDFEHVNLVGVFDADQSIHFPDFRSREKALHQLTQISGRAGRKHKKGLVIIQTSDPEQSILSFLKSGDQKNFYREELNDRSIHQYPPYTRLIKVIFRHREQQVVTDAAQNFHYEIERQMPRQVKILGPVPPLIPRIRNLYITEITLKIPRQGLSLTGLKNYLLASKNTLLALPSFKSVRIHFDVDPL
jgi:primosomal protein N' (replication factor Y)